MVLVASADARARLLSEDRVNVAFALSPEVAASLRARGLATRVSGMQTTVWLQFNPKTLGDVRVRSAFGHALNRMEITRSLYGGFAIPATKGLIPEGIIGPGETVVPSYNLQRARQLLSESGFSKRELRLTTPHSLESVGETISRQIAQLGIRLIVRIVEPVDTFARTVKSGEADLWLNRLRFGPDFTRLSNALLLPGGELNWIGLADPDVERLLTQRYSTLDSQVQAYKNAQIAVIGNKGLLYPIVHFGALYAVRREVRNFSIGPNGLTTPALISVTTR